MTFGKINPVLGETIRKAQVNLEPEAILRANAFFIQFIEEATELVIDHLRTFFESNPRVPAEYKFVYGPGPDGPRCDTDITNSGIHIGNQYNDKPRKFPEVLVTGISGNINDLFLAQSAGTLIISNPNFRPGIDDDLNSDLSIQQPETVEIGERLTGKIELSVPLQVAALDPVILDQVSDLVIYSLVGPVRRALAIDGLAWLPNKGSFSTVQIEQYTETQPIYKRTVTFGLWAEWYDDFIYEGISVEDIRQGQITLLSPANQSP